MARCKRCGREMENKREGFCSLSCYNLDLQEKISPLGKANPIIKRNSVWKNSD